MQVTYCEKSLLTLLRQDDFITDLQKYSNYIERPNLTFMLNLLDGKVTYKYKHEKVSTSTCDMSVTQNERCVIIYLRNNNQYVLEDCNDFVVLDERFQAFYNILSEGTFWCVKDLINRDIVSKEDSEYIKHNIFQRDIFVICDDQALANKLVGAFLDELIEWELEFNNLRSSKRRWLIIDDNGALKLRMGYLPNIRYRHSEKVTYARIQKSIQDGYIVINGIGFGLDTELCDICYKVSYGRTRYVCVARSLDDLKGTELFEGLEDDALVIKIIGGVVSIAF